jgi:hypothetical protein
MNINHYGKDKPLATEPTTIRLNIEGTELTISLTVDREDQTIEAVIADDNGHIAYDYADASTYEQRRLGETLLRWVVDGAD